ncbi:MAG: hypothetical protein WCF66_15540, partial [Pseudolabrys sp.]
TLKGRRVGAGGMDRVWQYAGTFIITIAGWILWCIFTRSNSFEPSVNVMALFIGALAFDIWWKTGPFK